MVLIKQHFQDGTEGLPTLTTPNMTPKETSVLRSQSNLCTGLIASPNVALPPSHAINNFAKDISGKEPGKPGLHWLKARQNEIVSCYVTGMDCARKRADSAFKYTLNQNHSPLYAQCLEYNSQANSSA